MSTLAFDSDYMEGAHPAIMARMMETNFEQTPGYGMDHYCASAREKIRKACGTPDAAVHFMVGGTHTNITVIDGLLRPHEGVISTRMGHISVHEAGGVEATGHKVLVVPDIDAKLTARAVRQYLQDFYNDQTHEHMAWPGMVYISHPTEYGTLYTKEELSQLDELCAEYNIPLFLDGARMGYGLTADHTDLTLEDIASYCDVFYIGATKVGALFGEAVVIPSPTLIPRFYTLMKQHGGMLAKGRLLGIQFDTLFTDDLYFKIARHAIDMAMKLRSAFIEKGYRLFIDSPTNQQFIIVENTQMAKLAEKVSFSFWEKVDESHTAIRFATSWATREEDVDALIGLL